MQFETWKNSPEPAKIKNQKLRVQACESQNRLKNTINCSCQSINSVFILLGMYNIAKIDMEAGVNMEGVHTPE